MSFNTFLAKIFDCFNIVLINIKGIFNLLIENNYIKFSFYLGVFLFMISLFFSIIYLIPKIFRFVRSEEDREIIKIEKQKAEKPKIEKPKEKPKTEKSGEAQK
ncbi:MAG: hypothetical protein MR265_01935 [Erysipelotrichaceae bacterium]|nr:hypothetical protein [Erysipelotrichaceae bacterium]